MVPFFVQIKCKLGQSYTVANALAEAEIASEIYSTAGDYDLLVKFYVDKETDIGHFINEKVQILPGIQDTHTIITFKAFGGGLVRSSCASRRGSSAAEAASARHRGLSRAHRSRAHQADSAAILRDASLARCSPG